jgi:molybdenum cofactor cytidylyltransferase
LKVAWSLDCGGESRPRFETVNYNGIHRSGILKICGILLAAGAAKRFGGGKLLHPLADGTPLGVASARNLLAALPDVVAVVRPGDDALAAALRAAGCEVAVCADAIHGMGNSLAHAVAARRDAGGWVIALADMPSLRPATIAAVARAIEGGAALAAPAYQGRRGHPVGIANRFRDDLLKLDGDAGARDIVAAHQDEIVLLDGDDAGVLLDIDRREDLPRGA